MMNQWRRQGGIGSIDPRGTATWPGATTRFAGTRPLRGYPAMAVVLGCGVWLAMHGGPALMALRPRPATTELSQEISWIDERLAAEQAPDIPDDGRRECLLASLHWDRAARLAMCQYYHQFGMSWTDDRETEFGAFEKERLRRDASGDVAAAQDAALHALALLPAAPHVAQARLRPLWYLSQAAAARREWDEAIGALVEITHYKPRQAWVWSQLAQAYHARRDAGRQEMAEEQAWRASAGRPLSAFITTTLRRTPYAHLAPSPGSNPGTAKEFRNSVEARRNTEFLGQG